MRENLAAGRKLVGIDALAMRVFVIHCFRRIVLRDPLIPAPYLPEDWPGIAARTTAAAIWRALFRASEAWLNANAASAYGPLPPRSIPWATVLETGGGKIRREFAACSREGRFPNWACERQELSDAIRGNRAAYQRHFELGGYMSNFEKWNQTLASLNPRSPAQTALISSTGASSASFQQTRLLMSLQLASSISWPLVVIVASWAMLLFFGFGVTSGLNPTSLGALAFGSFAVASAIF